MSKRRNRGRKRHNQVGVPQQHVSDEPNPQTPFSSTGEQRYADALTIMWMLSAVATLAAQLVAGLAKVIVFFAGQQELPKMVARVLPGWFLLCSVLSGIVCLILTPLAWHVRRHKPPISIMVTAIVIGVVPLIALTIIQLKR